VQIAPVGIDELAQDQAFRFQLLRHFEFHCILLTRVPGDIIPLIGDLACGSSCLKQVYCARKNIGLMQREIHGNQ
jgi:hypothetical protein